jgi:DNA-binding IscR family transcriptional regulator
MENKLTIQYALQCIEELANEPLGRLSLQDLSRRRGIPTDVCRDVLRRLEEAGILSADDQRRFGLIRPIEEITSLEILEALWTERLHLPAFKVLYQHPSRAIKTTLHAVRVAQKLDAFPGEAA